MAKAALQNKKQNVVTKKVQAKRSTKMETKKSEKVVELKKAAEAKTEQKAVKEVKPVEKTAAKIEPKTENKPEQKKEVKPVQEVKKVPEQKQEVKEQKIEKPAEVKNEEKKNGNADLKVVATPKMTATEAVKNGKNYETFLQDVPPAIIAELSQYPAAENKEIILIADLIQNVNSLAKVFNEKRSSAIIVWVTNKTDDLLINFANSLNETTDNNFGIFIFKTALKGNGMAFECVLKPIYKEKKSKARGNDFNLTFWKEYSEIAKKLNSKINAKPNDRQFKTISAGKTGVSIMQTVSREKLEVASEIYISDNKTIYDKLFAKKAEIEKETGCKLDWLRLDNKKASRIVARIKADLLDDTKRPAAINEQIKMGEKLQAIVKKYVA